MSADNGIYILQTLLVGGEDKEGNAVVIGNEYRVAHLQAIDNLNYNEDSLDPKLVRPTQKDYEDDSDFHTVNELIPNNAKHTAWQEAYRNKFHSDNPDVHIRNARKMFAGAYMSPHKENAWRTAFDMEQEIMESEFPVLEYGISSIRIDRVF